MLRHVSGFLGVNPCAVSNASADKGSLDTQIATAPWPKCTRLMAPHVGVAPRRTEVAFGDGAMNNIRNTLRLRAKAFINCSKGWVQIYVVSETQTALSSGRTRPVEQSMRGWSRWERCLACQDVPTLWQALEQGSSCLLPGRPYWL